MVTFLTILAAAAGFLAALISVQAFPAWLRVWHLALNELDRRQLVRVAVRANGEFEANIGRNLIGNDTASARLWVLFKERELSIPLYDTMHQRVRTNHGLRPFSLQSSENTLSAGRINRSFDEIRYAIIDAYERRGIRDLSLLNIGLVLTATLAVLAAYFLS